MGKCICRKCITEYLFKLYTSATHEKEEYALLPESKLILREHHCPDTTLNFHVPNPTEG